MEYGDVIEQIQLQSGLNQLERGGKLGFGLEPYWEVYQKVTGEQEPGPGFVDYMKKMIAEREAQGVEQYSPPPMTAGSGFPKWPFAGRKPEGENAENIFTKAIRRISGE